MEFSLRLIGKVNSELSRIEDCPLQENENAPTASITIFPEFLEGVHDFKVGSEILLLTWLHKANRSVIKCVMRNNYDTPEVGVFSTRSPDRPNPIGLHKVKVLSVESDGVIRVSQLEVLDQTPIVDIKPIL